MDENRYAPPQAAVEGAREGDADAPALWNPNAAANWSLLFTPIFGSWLHMRNWQALGQTERAESAKTWLLLSTLLLVGISVGSALVPLSGFGPVTGLVSLALLLAWYFGSARGQARWIADRYGNRYRRKRWWRPLLGALILYVANLIATALAVALGGMFIPR